MTTVRHDIDVVGNRARQVVELLRSVARMPERCARYVTRMTELVQASDFSARAADAREALPRASWWERNPLQEYVKGHSTGRGIWKWDHYPEVYHRHLSKFVGQPSHVLEIGIYSGGSLEMWRQYFGEACKITGVDIQPACKTYESGNTKIEIGDQADRSFWRSYVPRSGGIDVVIDDGGHTHEQQRVTLEELLPHLRPGGIFICEDVHGIGNPFAAYAAALADELNAFSPTDEDVASGGYTSLVTPFQQLVSSIHSYPYMVVFERSAAPFQRFVAERRGTEWQPFL